MQELVANNNITQQVRNLYNKFQIVVVWDLDFVKIYMSKILDNNDYNLQIAPSYQENLAHAR
jgi:hypothetical protein